MNLEGLATSVTVMQQNDVTVAWVGDNEGYLHKVVLRGQSSKLLSWVDISKGESIAIEKSTALDSKETYGYFLLGKTVLKFPVGSCSIYPTCSKCLRSHEDPLECGWCGDHCAHRDECPQGTELVFDKCGIEVHAVSPRSGPISGGTVLTLLGENFGYWWREPSNSISVTIGGNECQIIVWVATLVKCKTPAMEHPAIVDIVISVNDTVRDEKNYRVLDTLTLPSGFEYKNKGASHDTFETRLVRVCESDPSFLTYVELPIRCPKKGGPLSPYRTIAVSASLQHSSTGASHKAGVLAVAFGTPFKDRWDVSDRRQGSELCFFDMDAVETAFHQTVENCNKGTSKARLSLFFHDKSDLKCNPDHVHGREDVIQRKLRFDCWRAFQYIIVSTCYGFCQVNPKSGPTSGGTMLTIAGDNFGYWWRESTSSIKITLGGRVCEIINWVSSLVKCKTPPAEGAGKVDITISVNDTNRDAKKNYDVIHTLTLPSAFEYKVLNFFTKRSACRVTEGGRKMHCPRASLMESSFITSTELEEQQLPIVVQISFRMDGLHLPKNSAGEKTYFNFTYLPEQRIVAFSEKTAKGKEDGVTAVHSTSIIAASSITVIIITLVLSLWVVYRRGHTRNSKRTSGDERIVLMTMERAAHGEQSTSYTASEADRETFLKEALIMKDFDHPNVLQLIGLTVDKKAGLMVITPYMRHGDLHTYLRDERKVRLHFLSYCFGLSEDLVVRVADFGLSRAMYEKEYYTDRNPKTQLPIKWLAPESLAKSIYNHKTDVWAYGVLLWELMTKGAPPYPQVDNWDILRYLDQGLRMPKPEICPNELYEVMRQCWHHDPAQRPTFAELVDDITFLTTCLKRKKRNTIV
ncbi:hypothetical protein V5799_001486, partial [Amblyomma americanum]